MAQAGSGHVTEANPLGLALSFVEGAALVTLQDRGLGRGVHLRALELELAEVEFPLDLQGGAEGFQRRSTRLVHLVLEVDLSLLAEQLNAALYEEARSLRDLRLVFESGRLILEGRLGVDGPPVAAELLPGPCEEGVEVHIADARVFGPATACTVGLGRDLEVATRAALKPLAGRAADSVAPRGPWVFTFDPVGALLWALLPSHGWKLPEYASTTVSRLAFTPSGAVQLVVGVSKAGLTPPTAEPVKDQALLAAQAREDQDRVVPAVEAQVSSGAFEAAFDALEDAFLTAGGDRLFEQLVAVGVADPGLHDRVWDRVAQRLDDAPDAVPALLARAALSARQGHHAAALQDYEHAARRLRRQGLRRRAGLAYRAAAAHAESDAAARARLLEETIALRPDDVEALAGLVTTLPSLARASAAVRAARRLANLATDPEVRIQAHLAAARLLLDPVQDSAGAQREWERALKIAPEHPEALEGLAQALTARGDPRRAAGILDRLIQQAERAGDNSRAARLCLQLGNLWRPLDPEAARTRYRRAHELMPDSAQPVLALAQTAHEAGQTELALEVLDEVLPKLGGLAEDTDREAELALHLLAGRLYADSPDRATEAVAQLEAALRLKPEHNEALVTLTELHLRRSEPAAAAELMGRRAELAVNAGDPVAAAGLLRQQLATDPQDAALRAVVATRLDSALEQFRAQRDLLDLRVEVSRGHRPTLISALERRLLLEDPPEQRAALWADLAAAFEAEGKVTDAIRAYEEALAARPAHRGAASALVALYRARADEGRLESALARAAALSDDPQEQAGLHAERGRLLEDRGDEGEAWVAVQSALQAQPDDLGLLNFATRIALKTGEAQQARTLIERRLVLQSELPAAARLSAYVDLAKVEELGGDRRALVTALEQAYAAANANSVGGRRLAGRLATELGAQQDYARLAQLQVARGGVETAPVAERAQHHLDAARLFASTGQLSQAEEQVKAVLELADRGGVETEAVDTALQILEQVAAAHPDPGRRARVLVLRAQRSSEAEADTLRLEAALVLQDAGRIEDAIDIVLDAGPRLKRSRPLHARLAELQVAAGQLEVGAEAFAQTADLAIEEEDEPAAVVAHGQAAQAYFDAGQPESARVHDRAVLSLDQDPSSPWLQAALTRLGEHARSEGDNALLAQVLGRLAESAPPRAAAELLLEKGNLHLQAAGQEREGLEALRRAHALAPRRAEVADAVASRLAESLQRVGLFAEQAAVLSQWAELTDTPSARAERLFRAADVYAARLRDRSMALSRAQAAVRADPSHEAARSLRIALLREDGRTEALAEALSEEAAHSEDAEVASARWLEAAELIAPPKHVHDATQDNLTRALEMVRRAATAAPSSMAPVQAEVRYSRALGRSDEELSALGRLVDRALPPAEQAAARLRRAHLLRGALGDDVAAQAELDAAIAYLRSASADELEAVAEALPEPSRQAYEGAAQGDLRRGALLAQLEVTELLEDWPQHVAVLMMLVEDSEGAEERADLRVQAGEVLEWRLGDGAMAEREYLTALATDPGHVRAHRALAQFYTAVDRFGDLAESLGVQALVEVFEGFTEGEPIRRVAAAAEALWPELPEGGRERADVQLRLAKIYTELQQDADVVHVLELVEQNAPRAHRHEALVRLRSLFEARGRDDLLIDVLRRQAELTDTDRGRAALLAELGEALEWKMGDGQGAEREYRAALAADKTCAVARLRLAELLSSQDRFSEIATDLGQGDLRAIIDRLIEQGLRDRERVFLASAALGARLDEGERGELWLAVAAALEASPEDETARTREALESAAECPSTRALALQRLTQLLERVGDQRDLAEVLSLRAEDEPDGEQQIELRMQQARIYMDLGGLGEMHGDSADVMAEGPLRIVLALQPEHEEARALLAQMLAARGQWRGLGDVAGDEALASAQADAEAAGDLGTAQDILHARAAASEGAVRAARLVELVAFTEGEAVEDLYMEALVADPSSLPAQEGLRALLESQARFRELGERLSADALRRTLVSLKSLDQGAHLLPATLALATVLAQEPDSGAERVRLYLEAAALHQSEEDEDAAEHALREAIQIDPEHAVVREELGGLLVRQGRLEALADVDPALVAAAASRASELGDQEMEIRALRVLASRREGQDQANTLVLVAALEKARGHLQAAEEDLTRALAEDPQHSLARSELESILWASQRYAQVLQLLGPQAFLHRAALMVDEDPSTLLTAVGLVVDDLDDGSKAEAFELCGAARVPGAPPDEDRLRRIRAVDRAKSLWDRLEQAEGALRCRIVLVDLAREGDDVEVLLDALQDALQHAAEAEVRAALSIERATLLALTDAKDEAREVVQPILLDGDVPLDHRRGAARMLVEDLLPAEVEDLSLDDLDLRKLALEVLTGPGLQSGPDAVRWLRELAYLRELAGEDSGRVASALEAALAHGAEGSAAAEVRQQLRGLYEELGDWRGAERHASFIARQQQDPDLWVQVSELRAWLDDREGAQEALQSALEQAPAHPAAHASLLRLAEQTGDNASVIARLESWAESDDEGDAEARLERLLRAQALAVQADDEAEAVRLAERAVDLAPEHRVVEVVDGLCAGLATLGAEAAQVSLLSRVVSASKDVPTHLRLLLVDGLEAAGREQEAQTVLHAGIHRDTPEQDPLVERVLADAARQEDDPAARRLLGLAERLKGSPAARRLAALGAQRAEAAGERELARVAWQSVIGEVGAGAHAVAARQALVRLARAEQDDQTLLNALLESVDDAESVADKAARLVEAAELAQARLASPSQAEALLRRARKLVPDDMQLADRLLAHLRQRERWSELDAELRERAALATGAERARLSAARAEVAHLHTEDELKAARLWVEAYEAEPTSARGLGAARALQRAGVPDEALAFVQRVHTGLRQDDPEEAALVRLRCELLESLGRVDEAVGQLQALLVSSSAPVWAQYKLRGLLLRHQRFTALAELMERMAHTQPPGEGLRTQLAAARIRYERNHDEVGTRAALQGALTMVEAWMGKSSSPDDIAPPPLKGNLQSERLSFEAPLLDLAALAASVGAPDLRVAALRVYAQSLNEGLAQWRVLLMLGGAEREAGDLDAAEFTLRGVVDAIQDADAVDLADRAEAERALGALLLARGDAPGALSSLARAEALLRAQASETDPERAEVLVQLGLAHRANGDAAQAVHAMSQARLLDPDALSSAELDAAIEAAGPSPELAELMVRRGQEILVPAERAARLRSAAGVWESLGRPDAAYGPLLMAYEADPSNSAEAGRLEELLYEAERWSDLEELFRLRLAGEDLTDDARRTLLVARARLLESQLDRPEQALELFAEASAAHPRSDVLQELARLAGALDRKDLEQDALTRLAARAEGPELRRSALLAKAKSQGPERAVAALSEALDLSLEEGFPVTPLAERLARLFEARGDYASVARLWVRVAGARDGAGAAAAFARAGQVRLNHLDDRRGAASAFEAACRRAPEDLGLRRAALSLTESLGDRRRAETHARAGVEAAMRQGRPAAVASFARAQAAALAATGQVDAELEVWTRLLALEPSRATLDSLVVRAREALPADRVDGLLATCVEAAKQDSLRAQFMLARARVLDDPLGRHWEAEGLRADAERLDEGAVEAMDAASTPDSEDLTDADYRTMRSMLDRSGRWSELADLEEQQARRIGSRAARAAALLEVAALHTTSGTSEASARAKATLTQAVQLDPGLVDAHGALLRLQVADEEWSEAAQTLERLDELGGPPWPVPEAECMAAKVALALNDPARAKAALVQALDRDPHSVPVRARLAELDPVPARLRAWAEGLDPVLDADTLAEVAVAQAEAALEAKELRAALAHAESAAQAAPRSAAARSTLRRVLQANQAAPATVVQALLLEAPTVPAEAAVVCLQDALTLARAHGLPEAASAAAGALAPHAAQDPEIRGALAEFWRARGDGSSLVRAADLVGGPENLGEMSESERIDLGGALLRAGRNEEAWMVLLHGTPDGSREELGLASEQGELRPLAERLAQALSGQPPPLTAGGDALSRPETRAQLRSCFLDAKDELGPYALAGLTRCVVLLPGERGLAQRLAATLKAMDCVEDAAVEYRALLARDPGDLALLSALAEVLPFDDARGVRAVQAWLQGAPQEETRLPRLTTRLQPEREAVVRTDSPLGEALRALAPALGKILAKGDADPHGDASRLDPRLEALWSSVLATLDFDVDLRVDANGGVGVRIENRSRPTLVLGEVLLQEADEAALRFALARSAYLVSAGGLLLQTDSGADRQGQLATVVGALFSDEHEGHRALVQTLGAERVSQLQGLPPEVLGASELEMGVWRAELQRAAARFALWVCGDLSAAIAALDAIEPRSLAEPRGTVAQRCAAVRRWGPVADLVTWCTQAEFVAALSDGAFVEGSDARP